MRVLLDTHALLWWWEDSPRLPAGVRSVMLMDETEIFVSPVSLWEIATKAGVGKLTPAIPVDTMEASVLAEGFYPLSLTLGHGARAGAYMMAHRDPFDRMLAAQAELEDLVLITCDPAFSAFPCRTLW